MQERRETWLEVLEALLEGDRVALAKVTRIVFGYLKKFRAFSLEDSWEDICQQVLANLIRAGRRGVLRDERAFVSYVGAITRNELVNWSRKQSRAGKADLVGDPEQAEASARALEPVELGEEAETVLDLKKALEALPERERLVVQAIYLEGQTYQQAADALGMPLGTLKRAQVEGLRELRRSFLAEEGTG